MNNIIPRSISRLKQEATALCKEATGQQKKLSRAAALDQVAQKYHFQNWKALVEASDKDRAVKRATPPVSDDFLDDLFTPQEAEKLRKANRSTELPTGIKLIVERNKQYLAAHGIEFSIFEPTVTGLGKSILDATQPVRSHFESEKFHFFNSQGQGEEHKVIKKAHFVADEISHTKVSLYRPTTKQGDPRMWFSGLPTFAEPMDQIAIVIFQDELYLLNLSQTPLFDLAPDSPASKFIAQYVTSRTSVAVELLGKLNEIAKKPIKVAVVGDTAVGMAVELALNIVANSSKNPDFKGIEIKSGRGGKNRTTLFAQVADWNVSPLKGSAAILDKYGYQRGDDFKLYCTISTQKENSQGLRFHYEESTDQLMEKDRNGNVVAIWPGSLLRDRLLSKHAETFWIDADSIMIDGVEHFKLKSVTHTRRPLVTQLLPLIQSGVITMDHLIKRKGGDNPMVAEKGPLFKINKRDLALLFPEPMTYPLG
jgi:hypothetical protein